MFKVFKKNILLIIAISSFGPYVLFSPPLRTEHFMIYGALFVAILNLALLKIKNYNTILLLFLSIMFSILIITLLSTLMDPHYIKISKVFSSAENYIQNIAIAIIVLTFARNYSSSQLQKNIYLISYIVVIAMSLNTLISIASMFIDLSSFINIFIGPIDIDTGSVWSRSMSMGRYNGIFNQPLDAGIMYSIGLLGMAYIIKYKKKIQLKDMLLLLLILAGGFLTISKVFLFGGTLLFTIFILDKNILKSFFFSYRGLILILLFSFTLPILFDHWKGLNHLLRFFNNPSGIGQLTGGRFGDDSIVFALFQETWQVSPLYGFGFASRSPLDSNFAEFFVQGGAISLILYILILFIFIIKGIISIKKKPLESKYIVMLVLLIIGSGVGGLSFTGNRVQAIFMLLLSLLVLYLSKSINTKVITHENPIS